MAKSEKTEKPMTAPMNFQSMPQEDVPTGRNGKHKEIVSDTHIREAISSCTRAGCVPGGDIKKSSSISLVPEPSDGVPILEGEDGANVSAQGRMVWYFA